MKKSYSFLCKVSNIKYGLISTYKHNKLIIFIGLFCVLVGLLTGIFVAFKSGITTSTLGDYNLQIYSCQEYADIHSLLSRIFSYLCVLLILTVCSLTVFLTPIGFLTIAYRSYLIGFNCSLMIILFGVSGAINSLIIILPFQLASMLVFLVYFVLRLNISVQKRKIGSSDLNASKVFILTLIILILLAIVETLLLLLFNAGTILVI